MHSHPMVDSMAYMTTLEDSEFYLKTPELYGQSS